MFKEARETLLRMGTMRFVESLVTERPNPPARPLLFSNENHSLAFRFGVGDEPSASVGGNTSSIVPLPTLQFDSRAEDGLLSFFQSTPAGTHTLLSLNSATIDALPSGHISGQVSLQLLLLDPQAQSRAASSALGIRLCMAMCHHCQNVSMCCGVFRTLHTLLLTGGTAQELCTLDWRMRNCRFDGVFVTLMSLFHIIALLNIDLM